jgi:hypothetical protein
MKKHVDVSLSEGGILRVEPITVHTYSASGCGRMTSSKSHR